MSLGIAPGSRQVLQMLARDGDLADLIDAGARILESACGFCIGNRFSPKSGGVSVRTSNRNFEGRCGTKDAQVYLCSPEVAAAAAITGEFADPPEAWACPARKIEEPEAYPHRRQHVHLPRRGRLQRHPGSSAGPTSASRRAASRCPRSSPARS